MSGRYWKHGGSLFIVYLYHTFKKMWETGKFRAKPDPGLILSGKTFASGNSPLHVDSKYVLFEKPDYRTKNRDPGHKNGHKSCLDGTEPYSKGIIMISTKTRQP